MAWHLGLPGCAISPSVAVDWMGSSLPGARILLRSTEHLTMQNGTRGCQPCHSARVSDDLGLQKHFVLAKRPRERRTQKRKSDSPFCVKLFLRAQAAAMAPHATSVLSTSRRVQQGTVSMVKAQIPEPRCAFLLCDLLPAWAPILLGCLGRV